MFCDVFKLFDLSTGDGDGDVIRIRFTILKKTVSQISSALEDEIESEISGYLSGNLTYFGKVELVSFNPRKQEEVSVTIDLHFNQKLNESTKQEIFKMLYELIEITGSVGELSVDNFAVSANNDGGMYAYNYCNISDRGCPTGVHCNGEGHSCTATCDENTEYCLNGGTCMPFSDVIQCECPEGFFGKDCKLTNRRRILNETARIILIVIAGLVALLIFLLLLFCLCRKCQPKKRPNRELFGVENVVALNCRNEIVTVGGVAIQTDDSFLLNLSHANGVPPKPGYSHKVMQTNESFLLTRSQNPKVAQVKGQPHENSQSANGSSSSPSTSEGGVDGNNRETRPISNGNNSPSTTVTVSKPNVGATQTGGSLPRNIVKV
ncbi:hypothetical protein BSL78_10663 [Apostichopus japonicus]|uniref:EGF-like domain-containing protein n=1 Tax=Stichopus japonicus TaxID=307972 RepID=A0A2G8KWT8_STIJA|nr:hypothetical protein BSL78_10663 [Apostichopus japonicus]